MFVYTQNDKYTTIKFENVYAKGQVTRSLITLLSGPHSNTCEIICLLSQTFMAVLVTDFNILLMKIIASGIEL